jgi:PAS domain S-box-containing protein
VVAPVDLSAELGLTVLWRHGVRRVICSTFDKAQELARIQPPKVVVVGGLPTDEACATVRRLREGTETRTASLVVVDGSGHFDDEQRLRAAGATVVLPRPVDPAVWDARLAELLCVPPRRAARIPVRFSVWTRTGEESAEEGRTLNVSVRGMLLETSQALEEGRTLDLWLALPSLKRELRAVGRVVRTEKGADGRCRAGVEFLVLRGDAARRLAVFVEGRRAAASASCPAQAEESSAWESELRASEARQAAIVDSALDCVLTLDHEGHIQEFNRAAEVTFGYRRSEVIGRHVAETIVPPALREARHRRFLRALSPDPHVGSDRRLELTAMRADGSEFPAELAVTSFLLKGRTMFTVSLRDLTERRRREERFRALVENSSDVTAIASADGVLQYVSEPVVRVLGRTAEEVTGTSGFDLVHEDDLGRAHAAFGRCLEQPGSPTLVNVRGRHTDGSWRHLEAVAVNHLDNPAIAGVVVNFRDVTERVRAEEEKRRLEEQLRQAQRIEAVGRLAGGVAHDFNNLLAVILGYANLALGRCDDATAVRRNLEQIRRASERAASLTRQLLAFSRRQVLVPEVLDLGDVVGEVRRMLARLIGEDVEVVTEVAPDLGHVKADPGQVEQVLMNLAVNARDAMPGGGLLRIAVRNQDLDAAFVREHMGSREGPHVVLEVADSGLGMDEEVRSRIFEPFFTTKEKGKGTGLGLATVYGIVKQSGGYIDVETGLGRGARFLIYLPRVFESPLRAQPVAAQGPADGTETVLLVEDDPGVRGMTREVLESYGYRVLEARSGAEALRVSRGHAGPVALLLTDVVMPQMSGRALADHLAPERPEMKVLFASGYTDDAIVQHGVLNPGTEFLQKPFTPDALARRVRTLLDRG